MAGRPTKLTEKTVTRICDALRAGSTRAASARYAGIGKNTFYEWYKAFGDFRDAVKKAESDCEVSCVATIIKAAAGHDVERTSTKTRTYLQAPKQTSGDGLGQPILVTETETTVIRSREFSWQAAAWWLERRRPEEWAKFTVDPAKLTAETLAGVLGLFGADCES